MLFIPLNIPGWNIVLQLLHTDLIVAEEPIFTSVGSLEHVIQSSIVRMIYIGSVNYHFDILFKVLRIMIQASINAALKIEYLNCNIILRG